MHVFFVRERQERDHGLKFVKLMAHFSEYVTEYLDVNTKNLNKVAAR